MSLPIEPLSFGIKLTKKNFMRLPEGVYLVSSVLNPPSGPVFAEVVLPPEQRAEQWKRIKEARCDGRNCATFRSEEHHKALMHVESATMRNE